MKKNKTTIQNLILVEKQGLIRFQKQKKMDFFFLGIQLRSNCDGQYFFFNSEDGVVIQ
jgi:hypothetical protein